MCVGSRKKTRKQTYAPDRTVDTIEFVYRSLCNEVSSSTRPRRRRYYYVERNKKKDASKKKKKRPEKHGAFT